MLALLALRAGDVVGSDGIIMELWGEEPPRTAITTTQTYIYQLRRLIGDLTKTKPSKRVLATHHPGYVLRVDRTNVDAYRFHRLIEQARGLADDHPARSAEVAREALSLVDDEPLSDITPGVVLQPYVTQLREEVLDAIQLRIALDMRLGRHHRVVGELQALTGRYPLREWFHYQLMSALHRCGRRGEALHAYRNLERTLRVELGIDPSAQLVRLHRRILAGEPTTSAAGSDEFTIMLGA
ncbi:AfsR/SARP family transcriptional regulator [Crossiella sp. SN42]|nr:AfsR/SARP family transcriptional regulator [Crossiella sp. SN42]